MKIRSIVLAAVAAAALMSGRAAAQETDSVNVGRLRQACAGRMVRVTTTAGEEVRGQCGPVEDTRLLVVAQDSSVVEVPYRAVDGIWVRRSGFVKGVNGGALLGGILGGTWGALVGTTLCDGGQSCTGETVAFTVGSGVLGALTGGFIGGSIGSMTRVWIRLHP